MHELAPFDEMRHASGARLRGEVVLDDNGTIIFEWPERIEEAIPEHRLWIDLHVIEETRRNFIFEGYGDRYTELITKFRELTFGVK